MPGLIRLVQFPGFRHVFLISRVKTLQTPDRNEGAEHPTMATSSFLQRSGPVCDEMYVRGSLVFGVQVDEEALAIGRKYRILRVKVGMEKLKCFVVVKYVENPNVPGVPGFFTVESSPKEGKEAVVRRPRGCVVVLVRSV
jgi:hypothetical protein